MSCVYGGVHLGLNLFLIRACGGLHLVLVGFHPFLIGSHLFSYSFHLSLVGAYCGFHLSE